MNCLSLNIRGCEEPHKIEWLRRLKNTHRPDFIGLQETRVADSTSIKFSEAWGNDEFEMEYVNPTGRSGGIISIWDPNIFSKSQIVKKCNFIAVTGVWKGVSSKITVVNVYGPQSRGDKKKTYGLNYLN